MSEVIECPKCGRQLSMKAELAAKRLRCPRCQTVFTTSGLVQESAGPIPFAPEKKPKPFGPVNIHKPSKADYRVVAFGWVLIAMAITAWVLPLTGYQWRLLSMAEYGSKGMMIGTLVLTAFGGMLIVSAYRGWIVFQPDTSQQYNKGPSPVFKWFLWIVGGLVTVVILGFIAMYLYDRPSEPEHTAMAPPSQTDVAAPPPAVEPTPTAKVPSVATPPPDRPIPATPPPAPAVTPAPVVRGPERLPDSPPPRPALPGPDFAAGRYDQAVARFGADKVLRVVATGGDKTTTKQLMDYGKKVTGDARQRSSSCSTVNRGATMLVVAPVDDLAAAQSAIDFGEVTSIDEANRIIHVTMR